jgi:hypothetical protein
MRKMEFEVPAEVFGVFAEKLAEMDLDNRITGKNENDEIEVEVNYEKSESGMVDKLEDYLEQLIEQLEDDEDEDEEED